MSTAVTTGNIRHSSGSHINNNCKPAIFGINRTVALTRASIVAVIVVVLTFQGLLAASSRKAYIPGVSNIIHTNREENYGYSDEVKDMMKLLFANADRKIQERRSWLSDSHSEGKFFQALTDGNIWLLFTPVLPCFWYFEKVPDSATLHDGGKWLCGLQQVHESRRRRRNNDNDTYTYGVGNHYEPSKSCIVYSMGSNNEFSFERRIRTVAPGCIIHTFDPTVSMEIEEGKSVYDAMHLNYGFGGKDSTVGSFPVKSLATITKELGHDHIDVLKVDVEGFEWSFMNEVNWSTSRVGQLLVEVHAMKEMQPLQAKSMNEVFTKLELAGFYLISAEYVTMSSLGQAELVFLNKDWRPEGWR